MTMYDIIKKKRDGGELSRKELEFFVKGVTDAGIPDYQISALLMAIFLKGLNEEETANLTDLMMHSGDVVDLSLIEGVKVDKHSTGGVGDSITLISAPIVAALGVKVSKFSGRGLGHTGGTIDKLEAIPGFQTVIPTELFNKNVKNIGLAVAAQSLNICPADKKLYALRDLTATVEQIGLIASSIMSKKLASGADSIVLDIKQGSGAFMKDEASAKKLAEEMIGIGKKLGRTVSAFISDMSQPLGKAVGNSLEVIEAIEVLKGRGPEDIARLAKEIAAEMVYLAHKNEGMTRVEAMKQVESSITEGLALKKLAEMIEGQGGNPKVVEDYSLFKQPKLTYSVLAKREGYVYEFDTELIGLIAMKLGAGRSKIEDEIDYSAGLVLNKKIGDRVEKGEELAILYTDKEGELSEAEELFHKAMVIREDKVKAPELILHVIQA